MTPGDHTVTVRGAMSGAGWLPAYGFTALEWEDACRVHVAAK